MELTDRIALVTGASRGIGRATALALAEQGARVLVHYGRARDDADSLVAAIHATGGRAEAIGADLASPAGVRGLADAVRGLLGARRLDVLVANAGIASVATIDEQTVERFDELFAVNVRAPYFLVQQLLPVLADDASIVLLSSLAAGASVESLSAYSSTKGAIDTLVRHFAAALGPRGIRVNAVAPGIIETDMSSFARSTEGRDYAIGMQALKRVGQPTDVADVIAFLSTSKARWITGTTVHVDGGAKL